MPEVVIPQFRLEAGDGYGNNDVDRESQQQMLRAIFPGIRDAVRELLGVRVDVLTHKFHETHDMQVKDDLVRLLREYGKLREPWMFVAS